MPFDLQAHWVQYWSLYLSAFFAGMVDSIGGGGGLISVPAFLLAGVPYPLLLGTNKCMAAMGSGIAVIRYARAGVLPKLSSRTWFATITISIVGGVAGAAISLLPLVLDHLRYLVPILLFSVMIFLARHWILEGKKKSFTQKPVPNNEWFDLPLNRSGLGLIAGYDGVFGPGTGTFFLYYLERAGFGTMTATGLTKILNLSSNVGALVFFSLNSKVLWSVGLPPVLAFMAGNYLGSGLVLKRGKSLVRISVMAVTSLMLIKFVWANY